MDDAQDDAIAGLNAGASRRGANYVLLERATWNDSEVVVQGEAYQCRTAPLPPLGCSGDGGGLWTCSR